MPSKALPGDHADEADSALPAMRGVLPPALWSTIHRLSRSGATTPRPNPPADAGDDEGGGQDVMVKTVELVPLARLVTGQWGTLTSVQRRVYERPLAEAIGPQVGRAAFRRSLPILRENPSKPAEITQGSWVDVPFFERMRMLRRELLEIERAAGARYDRVQGPRGGVRAWVDTLRQLRGDVEWVLSQEARAEAGKARVVERDGAGPDAPVRSVMGINPEISQRSAMARVLGAARPPREYAIPEGGIPAAERRPWMIISAKGNSKLPFASYSTLPMASCPGAGSCRVEVVEQPGRGLVADGYCYSFTAWRYPSAFARQWRNALAEFVDREFAIYAGMRRAGAGGESPRPSELEERVALAYAGRGVRTWHVLCRQIVERDLSRNIRPASEGGRPAFVRLYVDGDINSEDNIFEWMVFCAELQRTRLTDRSGKVLHPGVQVYGYSKCWDQFLMLDRRRVEDIVPGGWGVVGSFVSAQRADVGDPYGGASFAWPSNYTLNMSGDSAWNVAQPERERPEGATALERRRRITVAMARLPISRGYFTSVNLRASIAPLAEQFANGAMAKIPTPPADGIPFPFNEARMRAILDINARMDVAGVKTLPTYEAREKALRKGFRELVEKYNLGDFARAPRKIALKDKATGKAKTEEKRIAELGEIALHNLYQAWFHSLYVRGADPAMKSLYASPETPGGRPMTFASIVLRELARDAAAAGTIPLSPSVYVEQERQDRMSAALAKILAKMDRRRVARAARRAVDDSPTTLADAILFADGEAAKLSERLRAPGALDTRLREAGLTKAHRDAFLRRFTPEEFSRTFGKIDAYQKKALSVALHEVLWTFNLGGSCPLVCGNCFDTPVPPVPGTEDYLYARHRCASRDSFRGATIHIGRH